MIFDTHAHYDDEAFDEDREALLEGLSAAGVDLVVNVGASLASTRRTIELTKQYPFVYGAAGVHPNETAELNEEGMARLKEAASGKKIVAVGEIGLDYYWDEPDRETQKYWFIRQLKLAGEMGLPVIIHSRDAAQDTYEILKEQHAEEIGGVIHCFSYSVEMAEKFLDLGFYIGLGGVVTFNNAKKAKEVAARVPLDRLVLETDCPYLAPVPYRGKRNQSGNLSYVAEAIGEIRGISAEEVAAAARENGLNLYRMKTEKA